MKKALLVIDIQNDYFWDKRLKKFNYDTNKVITSINNIINNIFTLKSLSIFLLDVNIEVYGRKHGFIFN